jgi:hypothetical protein
MRVIEGTQIFRLGGVRHTDDSGLDGEVCLAQTTALYEDLSYSWWLAPVLGWR